MVDIINGHGFDQLVHFPTRERNTLDLIITSLPNQFVDIRSPDCLSDHDIVPLTLKIVIHPLRNLRGSKLVAKEMYFNSYSDSRSVQENFNLITSFIQDSAGKHIQSKTMSLLSH